MKAAIMHAAGAVPEHGDFDEPVVGEGHGLVDMAAASIRPTPGPRPPSPGRA